MHMLRGMSHYMSADPLSQDFVTRIRSYTIELGQALDVLRPADVSRGEVAGVELPANCIRVHQRANPDQEVADPLCGRADLRSRFHSVILQKPDQQAPVSPKDCQIIILRIFEMEVRSKVPVGLLQSNDAWNEFVTLGKLLPVVPRGESKSSHISSRQVTAEVGETPFGLGTNIGQHKVRRIHRRAT